MTWNQLLFAHWKKHGGQLFSSWERDKDGILLVEHPKGPVLLQLEEIEYRDISLKEYLLVRASLELEHPYALDISQEGLVGSGVNLALGVWKQVTSQKDALGRYIDQREGLKRRQIQTSRPAMTRQLFQNTSLVHQLNQHPQVQISLSPAGVEDGQHQLMVRCPTSHTPYKGQDFEASWEQGEEQVIKRCEQIGFSACVLELVELTGLLRDQLLTWPMPPEEAK